MKTILLVDDEYALLEVLSELLNDEGYRVVTAMNGKEALTRLQSENPDLLLTDHMMPIADGRELVRTMRQFAEFRSTPVVMMSATAKSTALSDAKGTIEVSAFLNKPFDWDHLMDAIVRLIGKGQKKSASPSNKD
jgi:CheY-like chemotaxis protein